MDPTNFPKLTKGYHNPFISQPDLSNNHFHRFVVFAGKTVFIGDEICIGNENFDLDQIAIFVLFFDVKIFFRQQLKK